MALNLEALRDWSLSEYIRGELEAVNVGWVQGVGTGKGKEEIEREAKGWLFAYFKSRRDPVGDWREGVMEWERVTLLEVKILIMRIRS